MNELKKYSEIKAAKQKEMSDLIEKAKKEERAFTEEENALFDKLEGEINAVNDTMEKINKSRKLTEVDDDNLSEEKEKGGNNMPNEQRDLEVEQRDLEEFGRFIRNEILEQRDTASQFSKGTNGNIIPVTIANKIIMTAYNVSPILNKATPYNVKGKLSIPVYGKNNSDDITVSYATEFTELTEHAGKFTTVDLDSYLIGALAKIGNSLINNTDIDIANIVINILAEYARIFLEKECLKGTTGKIVGCSGITNILELATAAITYDSLVKLKNKVIQTLRKGSIWVMNQNTQTAIELLKDSDGRPLFQPDPTGEFDGMILGYPVYISDNMDDIAAGKRPIIFGNFSGLALKTSKELEIQVLRELYATQHATGIVAWMEVDAKIEHVQKLAALDIATA